MPKDSAWSQWCLNDDSIVSAIKTDLHTMSITNAFPCFWLHNIRNVFIHKSEIMNEEHPVKVTWHETISNPGCFMLVWKAAVNLENTVSATWSLVKESSTVGIMTTFTLPIALGCGICCGLGCVSCISPETHINIILKRNQPLEHECVLYDSTYAGESGLRRTGVHHPPMVHNWLRRTSILMITG